MKFSFLIFALFVCFILITGTGCKYSDYIKNQFLKQEEVKEGEVCVKIEGEVVCGTPAEIEALQKGLPQESKEKEVEVGKIPVKEVTENDLVSFPNLKATDPDGDSVLYNFTPPLNSKGQWQTKEGDAGSYIVTIYASDGKSTIFQDVKIIVNKFNHPPVLDRINDILVNEGDTIPLSPKYSDVDKEDNLNVSYSGFMKSNTYKTTYDDAGLHTVTVTVSDGRKKDSQDVKITVKNVNRQPVLVLGNYIQAVEKDLIKLDADATDPDGDSLVYTYSAPFNKDREWQTKIGDHGNYTVTVTVSDGNLSDTKKASVYVEYWDKPPYFEKMDDITLNETGTLILRPLAFDPEGKEITFNYSGWMDSNIKKTTYDDAGVHKVEVTASDGFNKVNQTITITVNNVNRQPVFVEGAFK